MNGYLLRFFLALLVCVLFFCLFGMARAKHRASGLPGLSDGGSALGIGDDSKPALRLLYVANTNGVLQPCPT